MLSPTAGSITAVPTRRDWISLAVLSVGLGVIVLDGTIVGVALPAIITDLKLDITQAQWVNSLYAVCLLYTSPSPRDQRGSRMPSSA